jgi:hypothetical protein
VHERLGVDLDPASVRGLGIFKDFLHRWGFLAQDFDLASWLDPAPLAALSEVRPKRLAF